MGAVEAMIAALNGSYTEERVYPVSQLRMASFRGRREYVRLLRGVSQRTLNLPLFRGAIPATVGLCCSRHKASVANA